jgi:hypothetical protein
VALGWDAPPERIEAVVALMNSLDARPLP